ncbi:hypothetical protein NE237_003903 [Protea cynaroides]|uniref:Uncharacterized protein n=1 Tax=Protea cynaroides TaxID=273540 RepID=A0A9Q0KHY2_9MAGN|nr:hypothetical protein NE237_003903 [Protea cynaroides]
MREENSPLAKEKEKGKGRREGEGKKEKGRRRYSPVKVVRTSSATLRNEEIVGSDIYMVRVGFGRLPSNTPIKTRLRGFCNIDGVQVVDLGLIKGYIWMHSIVMYLHRFDIRSSDLTERAFVFGVATFVQPRTIYLPGFSIASVGGGLINLRGSINPKLEDWEIRSSTYYTKWSKRLDVSNTNAKSLSNYQTLPQFATKAG